MKKLLIIAALFFMISCSDFNPTMKYKVIGDGEFSIAFTDNSGTRVVRSGAHTFEKEIEVGETWVLMVKSNEGKGVKLEAYIADHKLMTDSASGNDFCTLKGTY